MLSQVSAISIEYFWTSNNITMHSATINCQFSKKIRTDLPHKPLYDYIQYSVNGTLQTEISHRSNKATAINTNDLMHILSVLNVDSNNCKHSSFVRVDATEGYIASTGTERTGCGTIDTPWYINAQPGQRINITLWDFDVINQVTGSRGPGGLPSPCHVYAIIKVRICCD